MRYEQQPRLYPDMQRIGVQRGMLIIGTLTHNDNRCIRSGTRK